MHSICRLNVSLRLWLVEETLELADRGLSVSNSSVDILRLTARDEDEGDDTATNAAMAAVLRFLPFGFLDSTELDLELELELLPLLGAFES